MEFISQEEAIVRKAPKTISLVNNDRELDEHELLAEKEAVYYPITVYKRIKPVPGTLAYLLRNFKGRNEAVMEFLKEAKKTNNSGWLKNLCICWENMDEYSRNRADVFDLFCNKWNVQKKKFWGVLQEGLFDNNDALTMTALSEFKPQFVEILKKHAANPKNHQDRKLYAEVTGLRKDSPLINVTQKVENNTTNNTQNNNISSVPSFAKSIRRTEISEKKPKEITEGKQDYVDAEFSVVEERELEESRVA